MRLIRAGWIVLSAVFPLVLSGAIPVKTPVAFQRDAGQLGGGADFLSQGLGYSFALHPGGAVMSHGGHDTVTMTLAGADPAAEGVPVGEPVMITNHYRGRDRSRWLEGLQSFERVRYTGVYDGIDVEYYGRDGQLEYDFVVKPGADPARIGIVFSGARALCLDEQGALVLDTPAGEVRHLAPYVYQRSADGTKRDVPARYELRGNRVAFSLGGYDRTSELVIDPAIVSNVMIRNEVWSPRSMHVAADGTIYLTGVAGDGMLPVNAIVDEVHDPSEPFAMKLAPNGTVLYATYFGGEGTDAAVKLAVDGSGNVYIAGVTDSTDFPVSANAFQSALGVDALGTTVDSFVVKLSSSGALVYSTYLGGGGEDLATDIGIDSSGHAYVGGGSDGNDFPGTISERPQTDGDAAGLGWVAKLAQDGSATEYVTILGANDGRAAVNGIAVDGTGAVYVGGEMTGSAMLTTAGVFQPVCSDGWEGSPRSCIDGFIGKLTPAGSLELLTFLGGTGADAVKDIGLGSGNDILILGTTLSFDFPVTSDAVQTSRVPGSALDQNDAFYARLDPDGEILKYSTYLSGDGEEYPRSLSVDGSGRAILQVDGRAGFPWLDQLGFDSFYPYSVLRFSTSDELEISTVFPVATVAPGPADVIYAATGLTGGLELRQLTGDTPADPLILWPEVFPAGEPRLPESNSFHRSVHRVGIGAEAGQFQSGVQVTVGGQSVTIVEQDETELTISLQSSLPAGVHDVTVTNPGKPAMTLPGAYEKMATDFTLTGVTPSTVPAAQHTTITVTGTGFPPQARVSLGSISQAEALSITTARVNSNTLRAVVPRNIEPGVYDLNVEVWRLLGDAWLTLPSAITIAGPAILGINPPVAPSSGGTVVKVESFESPEASISLNLDGLPAPFTGTHRHFTVPAHAPGRVDAAVTAPAGTRTLSDSFLYYQAVTAAAVSPANGTPAGGTAVTITGTGFLPGARVTFGSIVATDVVVESSTTITAFTPAHVPGPVPVIVRNADGGSATIEDGFRYDGPVIFSVAKTTASQDSTSPIAGGVNVRVAGEGFEDGARVWFDDVEGTVTGTTPPHTILVDTPPHAKGTADVSVVNPGGETGTLPEALLYLGAPPVITNVSPNTGPAAGGTSITITGSGFDSNAQVTVGGAALLDPSITATSITGLTPPGTGGTRQVRVRNPADGQSDTDSFLYLEPPAITSVSPASGPAAGGSVVTIDGANFSVDAEVFFGGTPAQSVLWEASTQLLVGTPAHSVGTFEVTVTNGDGQSATKNDAYRFLPPPPTIDSFTPTHAAPGNSVIINGGNFQFVTGVKFHNNRTATYAVNNSAQITATVPSFAETGPITITTESGTVTSTTDFTVDETAPEITSFTPGSGAPGTTVTITGVRFTGAISVEFGGFGGAYTVDSDTQITATVPGAAKSGPIVVRSAGGVGTSEDSFFVAPRFSSTPFSPKFGLPGTAVTINGVNFGGTTEVLFNGVAATPFTVNGAGISIATTVPASATTGFVTVTAAGGSATTTTKFAVTPQVDSFTPTTGAPGGSVVLAGVRFTGATAVTFGGVAAASFTVDSDTQITAVTASGAKTGTVCVTTPGATGCSTGVFSLPPRFNSSPFSPSSSLPGTSIDINGVNFQGTTAVSFNGVAASTFTANAAGTQIEVTVPEGTTTGPVTVTAQGGTATSAKNFGVPPAVTSFSPSEGGTGTVVTLTGVRFTGATAVKFGTVAASSFSVVGDTQLTATVSATAKSGTICVTTPGGTGCSTGTFTVPARITGFSPANALPGAAVTINGANFHGTSAVSFFDGQAASPFAVNAAGTSITTTVPANATTGPVTVTTPLGIATSTTNFGVQPAVSGFTPSQGEAGVTVTITGVRLTGATAVKFGGTSGGTASAITVVSDTEISAVVPANGKSGTICVTTPGGTGCSAGSFSMPPRVTGFNPDNALPGANVTIEGVNFHGATAVSFHNGQAQPTFTVNAAGTAITTTVPAGAITGPVTVTTPIGTNTSTVQFGVQPAVTGFTPSQGDPGVTVTITGVRFTGATAVKFGGTSGGTSTAVTVNSDTQITATVPSNGKSGTICVTTPGGTGCSAGSFSMPPRVTGFNPDNAWPGAAVTVEGVNFHGATALTFHNGQAAPSFIINPAGTTITTTVPAAAITGPVIVTTPIGTTVSTVHFGVQPEVTSFDPVTGEAGTVVTLTGVRFTGATVVKFGGTSGGAATTFSVASDTSITATVPANGKSGTICVTTSGGTGCSTGTFTMPPRITGFSPSNALPGANVTINGANFHDATAVAFNGVAQPTFTVNSAGTGIATTVPATATTGPVTVTTPIGTATSATNFGVQAVVSGFTPASGDVGTVVTITGQRFTGATAVKFGGTNGVAATVFTVVDAETITAEVPAAPKSGTICVTTAASTVCSSGTFSVPPRITGFSTANALPGANVTINGFNFHGATAVSFNGTSQPTFTVNAAGTSVTTTVPAGATTGPVSVTTPFGTGTSAANFGVLPVVTSFTPTAGDSGDTITITGERLADASAVKFGGTSGVAATTFAAVGATTVTAVVPPTAKTGTICVTTAAGTACSAGTFTVGPRITSFTPTSGLPGASVTIAGLNFQGTTAVAFNGTNQPAFTVNASGTSIATTVPAGATTGPIAVTTPVSTATSTTNFGVLPVVDGFTPSAGGPGTVVTVTGVRFTGATAVKFNTTTATFSVVNDTTVSATVPAAATTGKIHVTTPAGTGSSVASFTVGPKITSFTPTKGAPGTSVTINGSAFTGAAAVAFNDVPAAAFTVNTSTKITATVPAGATTGLISVTTPAGGTGFSSTLFYAPAAISGFSPSSGAPGAAVTITGTSFNDASAVAFNGAPAAFSLVSPTQINATVPDGAATGPLSVTTPFGPASSGSSFTVLAAPPPVLAATGASATAVAVSWTGSATAQFDVQRATTVGGGFTTLARVTGLSFNDLAASANKAYLYRVVRVSDGVASNVDHTTTVVFTDDPVLKKLIRLAHLTQLRTAVNALRACAGLAPATWTDPTPSAGLRIKAVHTTELRAALDPALAALGRSVTYTDPTLTAKMLVKAVHHQQLRNAVR